MGDKEFRIEKKDDLLEIWSVSYKAEKGSVLHSGIYNPEMASSLAAGACITVAGFFVAGRYHITALHYGAALVFFALLFLAFRTFVFRETVLYACIDRVAGVVRFSLNGAWMSKGFTFSLDDLQKVRQDYVFMAPVNPDGIKLVRKIALQHGTVIPGFGEKAEFHTVTLEFRGGQRVTILSSSDPLKAEHMAKEIQNFIER